VSMFYEDFEQVEDDYVINILKKGEKEWKNIIKLYHG
jgi:predicted phosphoribosyltransferase